MLHALNAQWRAALRPATDAERRILFAQLTLVRDSARPIVVVMPIASGILGWAMWEWASPAVILAWAAVMLAASLHYDLLWRRFDADGGPQNAELWARRAAASATLFTVVWGGGMVLFWAPGEYANHLLLVLVLACSLSGNSALTAPHLPTAIFGATPYATTLVGLCVWEGGGLYYALAGLCFCFAVLMLGQAWQINQTTRNMLLLREDKDALVAQLAASKSESDRARARAEAANAAKSEFLANMSHELRTPLNAILGFSEIMKTEALGPVGSKVYVDYAGHIFGSGTHLLGLINDILDLSRIEAGRYQVTYEELDLAELAEEAMQLCAQRAERGGLTLKREIAPLATRLTADARAVRQIFINLLSNAVKFTPAGGRVTLFARPDVGGGIAIGVCDTGVGIAPDDQALVFQSFGQGRHDIAVSDGGTGLGLPIVKGLAEAHGGRVTLISAPGEGTTVSVHFPVLHVPFARAHAS